MAWAGIFLGMIAGLFASVLGYSALGLPLWLSLLVYTGAGTAVALLTTALLAWRGPTDGPEGRLDAGMADTATA
jgi:apolipoprotein N-acyltransferase